MYYIGITCICFLSRFIRKVTIMYYRGFTIVLQLWFFCDRCHFNLVYFHFGLCTVLPLYYFGITTIYFFDGSTARNAASTTEELQRFRLRWVNWRKQWFILLQGYYIYLTSHFGRHLLPHYLLFVYIRFFTLHRAFYYEDFCQINVM